jgi:hypothetical protein
LLDGRRDTLHVRNSPKNPPILDAVMDMTGENLVLSTNKYKSNYIEYSITEMPAFEY